MMVTIVEAVLVSKKNHNTVEIQGIGESVHKQIFNYGEFATTRSLRGLNTDREGTHE